MVWTNEALSLDSRQEHIVKTSSRAYPASYPRVPGVTRQRREDDSSTAEINNAWSYIHIAPVRIHGVPY
jgi:hypothetical protein